MFKKLFGLAMAGMLVFGAVEVMAKGPGAGGAGQGQGQMYRYQGGKGNEQAVQQQDQLKQQKRDQQRQRLRDPQLHQQTPTQPSTQQ